MSTTIDHMPGPFSITISLGVLGAVLIFFAIDVYFLIRNRNQ